MVPNVTAEEAAAILRVSAQTVRDLARRGELKGLKVGKAWRFHPADLNQKEEDYGKD